MSLHLGVVSIEGDHLEDVPDIFQRCNYGLLGLPQTVHSTNELSRALDEVMVNRTTVKKAAYVENGWTHIMDFELVMITEESLWAKLSEKWNAKVLCWVCEGTSGTYMFSLFGNGKKVRSVEYVDGDLSESGNALLEEVGIDWNQAFEDDILNLAERLGAPYRNLDNEGDYRVYLLDESHLLPENL